MLESSPGKKLSQARLAKKLTIDEVAHATKLRPDKIVALENDDFSRFGSIAYGKGFLQIYARFLGIDITDQLRTMEIPASTVSISDYQYLNTEHPPVSRHGHDRSLERGGARRERRPPSVMPLFVVLSVLCVGGYFFFKTFYPSLPKELQKPAPSLVEPDALTAPPAQAGDDTKAPGSNQGPQAKPSREVAADVAFLAATSTAPRLPVARTEIADPGVMNEVIVEPIKKTWVKIHKDSPDSPPIFEDYLYPGVRPLKLRGAKFFVEVRDQSAVQIRKNGHPIAYQSPGISIQ
jgi:cytoskeletal protein RodZ